MSVFGSPITKEFLGRPVTCLQQPKSLVGANFELVKTTEANALGPAEFDRGHSSSRVERQNPSHVEGCYAVGCLASEVWQSERQFQRVREPRCVGHWGAYYGPMILTGAGGR
jgi:hypothetical protein